MPLERHKTVRDALRFVAANPHWPDENLESRLEMPVWELVARNLFDIANYPDAKVVGSVNKATRAQRILLDRLSGTRRMGTNPAVKRANKLQMVDLTVASIPPLEDTEEVTTDDNQGS